MRSARRRATRAALLAVPVLAAAGPAQVLVRSHPFAPTEHVVSLAGGGDLDADGYDDVVAGYASDRNATPPDRVVAFSGRTGSVLRLWTAPAGAHSFGWSVAIVGDVDADGHADVAVGDPNHSAGAGALFVLSGGDGSSLWTHLAPAGSALGMAVAAIGDVDGDGFDDVGASGNGSTIVGPVRPHALFMSGRTGGILHRLDMPAREIALAGIGDVDADGYDDVVIGNAFEHATQFLSGAVSIVSGATGGVVVRIPGRRNREFFGRQVTGLGDVDGDGVPDFTAASFANGGSSSEVLEAQVRSGADGSLLRVVAPVAAGDGATNARLAGGGDFDGDGVRDLILGYPIRPPLAGTTRNEGTVFVASGASGAVLSRIDVPASGHVFGIGFGTRVCGGGDGDGDGFADIVALSSPYPFLTFAPEITVWSFRRSVTPYRSRFLGSSCRTSTGTAPRIRTSGRTTPGRSWGLSLRGATPNRAACLLASIPATIPLDPFGMPGCTLHADLAGVCLGATTDAIGAAAIPPLTVPNTPALVGGTIAAQWLIDDPGANPRGLAASNAVHAVFGY